MKRDPLREGGRPSEGRSLRGMSGGKTRRTPNQTGHPPVWRSVDGRGRRVHLSLTVGHRQRVGGGPLRSLSLRRVSSEKSSPHGLGCGPGTIPAISGSSPPASGPRPYFVSFGFFAPAGFFLLAFLLRALPCALLLSNFGSIRHRQVPFQLPARRAKRSKPRHHEVGRARPHRNRVGRSSSRQILRYLGGRAQQSRALQPLKAD